LPPSCSSKEKKTIIWFGKSGKGKWEALDWFRQEVLPSVSDKWEFVTVSDHKDSTFKWETSTAPEIINKADLAIIPVSQSDSDQVKSANRCTQSMAFGVPVLCHYTRSYREVIVDNYNGMISSDKNEWIAFIRRLEDDEFLTTAKVNAFRTAEGFSMDNLIDQWISSLKLSKGDPSPSYSILILTRFLSFKYSAKKFLHRLKKKVIA
jgi:glycosyltransferase involved in cell wall biosynthesis